MMSDFGVGDPYVGCMKAAVLTVAAGSRMRGQADFGWGDQGSTRK